MSSSSSGGGCRFCTNNGTTISLHDPASFTDRLTLAEVVYDLADVTVPPDDTRSQCICTEKCLLRLEDCYLFKQQIRKAEVDTRSILQCDNTVKVEIDNTVPEEEYETEFLIYEEDDNGTPDGETKNWASENQLNWTDKFTMPHKSQIVTYLEFENFDYIKIRGEKCCGCDFIAKNADELEGHSKKAHVAPGTVKYKHNSCKICMQFFEHEADLQKHRSYYDTKELFLCKLCQSGFHGKEALMIHMESSINHTRQSDAIREDGNRVEHSNSVDTENDQIVEVPATEGLDVEIESALEQESNKSQGHRKLPEQKLISSIEDHDLYQIIHIENAERCCGCGLYFETIEQMLQHARNKHQYGKNVPANSTFCEICYETFKAPWGLSAHKTHCRNVKQLYYCKLCQFICVRKFHLTKHFETTPSHVEDSSKLKDIGQISNNDQTSNDGHFRVPVRSSISFACCFLKCSFTCDSEKQLLAHVAEQHAPRRKINLADRTSEENVCTICLRSFSSQQLLLLHRNRPMKKKHICSFCADAFLIPSKLREHEQLVHSENVPQHPCDVCGKVFRTTNLLKLHRLTHNKEREFPCVQCGAQFRFRFQLKKHMQGVHPTDFPYECRFCEKKFSTKAKHDLHVRSHTGEKPYVCRHDACGKQFSHVTDRKRHEMGVHTGERPHRCNQCSAAYIRKRELLIHLQKHQVAATT